MQINPGLQAQDNLKDLPEKLSKATSPEHALQIAEDAGYEAFLSVEDEGKSWFLLINCPPGADPTKSSLNHWKTIRRPFPLQVFRLISHPPSGQLEIQDFRSRRMYNTSPLPILIDGFSRPSGEELKLRMDIYKEICSTWRLLTDVRFKLLGFVPVISGALLLGVLGRPDPDGGLAATVRMGLAVLGLLVTVALNIYEKRNSELYNELISRGRRIEAELGIDTGHFRGRPEPRDERTNHSMAIDLIYGATGIAWLLGIIATAINW